MIGRTVSHYKVVEEIGSDGLGVVYRAEDSLRNTTVALRVIGRPPPGSVKESGRDLEPFRREALASAALDHPNISGICEIDEIPDIGTIVAVPFLEGETLRERIDQGPLHIQETVEIAHEIAAGLSCAHDNGIVHRDLTPSNVIILRGGLVKILDFGLSAHPRHRKVSRADKQSVASMSPEQLRDEPVDRRTDIWALGVMTYEMVTGRLPFEGDAEAGLGRSILSGEPLPLPELRPDCPLHLADIIQRCLQKDPASRFQSTGEFIQQLKILSGSIRMDRALFTRPLKKTPEAGAASTLGRIFWPAAAVLAAVVITAVVLWQGLGGERRSAGAETNLRLAVLPLENRAGNDPGDDFVNGLFQRIATTAEDLEPYHRSMWVLPYSQTASGMPDRVAGLRDAFGVNRLLTGSVQRSGDGYRLTLDILDAETLSPVESKHIDFRRESAHSLHTDVYDAVADLLDVAPPPGSKPEPQPESMAGVYEKFLEGIGILRRSDTAGGIDAAIDELRRTVRVNSSFAPAWASLADAYREKHRLTGESVWLARAEANCRKALELDESLVGAHMTLAEVYEESGREEQAIEEYSRVLSLNPRNTTANREVGDILAAQNRLDEAESAYRRIVDAEPDYFAGHRALGYFYYATGRIDEAASEYKEALRLAPDDWRTLNNLGDIHVHGENWGEARKLYTRSFRSRPACGTASSLGTVLFLEGRLDDAAHYHRFAFENCDSTARYHYRHLGAEATALYWTPDRRPESLPLFRRAVTLAERTQIETGEDTAIDVMVYYALLGDRAAAEAAIAAVAGYATGDADLLFRIGCAREWTGNRDLALQHIGDAVERGFSIRRVEAEPGLGDLRSDLRYGRIKDGTTPGSPGD